MKRGIWVDYSKLLPTSYTYNWMTTMKRLDLTGSECPIPFIRAIEEFSNVNEGETLEIVMDSKRCVELLEESVKTTRSGDIKVEEISPGIYKVTLIKKKATTGIKSPASDSC